MLPRTIFWGTLILVIYLTSQTYRKTTIKTPVTSSAAMYPSFDSDNHKNSKPKRSFKVSLLPYVNKHRNYILNVSNKLSNSDHMKIINYKHIKLNNIGAHNIRIDIPSETNNIIRIEKPTLKSTLNFAYLDNIVCEKLKLAVKSYINCKLNTNSNYMKANNKINEKLRKGLEAEINNLCSNKSNANTKPINGIGSEYEFYMKNDTYIPYSRTNKEKIRNNFHEYIRNERFSGCFRDYIMNFTDKFQRLFDNIFEKMKPYLFYFEKDYINADLVTQRTPAKLVKSNPYHVVKQEPVQHHIVDMAKQHEIAIHNPQSNRDHSRREDFFKDNDYSYNDFSHERPFHKNMEEDSKDTDFSIQSLYKNYKLKASTIKQETKKPVLPMTSWGSQRGSASPALRSRGGHGVGISLKKLNSVPKLVNQMYGDYDSKVFDKHAVDSPRLLRTCSEPPRYLNSFLLDRTPVTISELHSRIKHVKKGGRHSPSLCRSKFTVAVIIPYRQSMGHLPLLLNNLHRLLQLQLLDYGIFVIEQKDNKAFNRAKLLNVGFIKASESRLGGWDCVVFHDVDIIAVDSRNTYGCPTFPVQLCPLIDSNGANLKHRGRLSGIVVMSSRHFVSVNGYSNKNLQGGQEDDDLYLRVIHEVGRMDNKPNLIGRCTKLPPIIEATKHPLYIPTRMSSYKTDGLNTIGFTIISQFDGPFFTHIAVSFEQLRN